MESWLPIWAMTGEDIPAGDSKPDIPSGRGWYHCQLPLLGSSCRTAMQARRIGKVEPLDQLKWRASSTDYARETVSVSAT